METDTKTPLKTHKYARVIIDRSLDRPLDYAIPENLQGKLTQGMRVRIPVRKTLCKGTVIETMLHSKIERIQPISEVLSDESILTEDIMQLAHWMSNYYATPLTKVFKSLLGGSLRKDHAIKQQYLIERAQSATKIAAFAADIRSKYPKQVQVLDILLRHPKGLFLTKLKEQKISESSINTLIKKEILQKRLVDVDRTSSIDFDFFPTEKKTLSTEQQAALDAIISSMKKEQFRTHLLWGITGSGKTEVYLQAIQHALEQNMGVLMLVPEVALTTQMIERIKSRFPQKIAILHHRIASAERADTYRALRKGEVTLCIGARSAVFCPMPNLKLLIVDEEHENSYKQTEEMPCYNARDVAIMRGKLNEATVILGSATPSVETYYNAQQNKYTLSILTKRPTNAKRPHIHLVDMKLEQEKHKIIPLFSDLLLQKLERTFERGEQSLLFLNRRGYYACKICNSCKQALQCPHCDVALTFHKSGQNLSCHLCGYHMPSTVTHCPSCNSKDAFIFKGRGTEQVQKALHAIFPDIRSLRMDRDTTRHQGSFQEIYNQFRSHKADVLIGTQMIAKGFDFHSVTLVGVLQADASLHIPDFRADEIAFQMITQVAGRSGRGALPGEVVLQSFLPKHPIIQAAMDEDYPRFYDLATEERKEFSFPPYCRLAKCLITGYDSNKTERFAESYRNALLKLLPSSFTVHPVMACGYKKIKDRFRFQFIIKSAYIAQLGTFVHRLQIRTPKHIHVLIDVDPSSTFH